MFGEVYGTIGIKFLALCIIVLDGAASTLGTAGVDYSLEPIYMVTALHIYHMIPFLDFHLRPSGKFMLLHCDACVTIGNSKLLYLICVNVYSSIAYT